jgi:hypothetical protein
MMLIILASLLAKHPTVTEAVAGSWFPDAGLYTYSPLVRRGGEYPWNLIWIVFAVNCGSLGIRLPTSFRVRPSGWSFFPSISAIPWSG